jgi:hypothetical protein
MANAVILRDICRDGRSVLESSVTANVRFSGDNLGVTNKLAKNTARVLKRSLPQPAPLIPQQAIAKGASATS